MPIPPPSDRQTKLGQHGYEMAQELLDIASADGFSSSSSTEHIPGYEDWTGPTQSGDNSAGLDFQQKYPGITVSPEQLEDFYRVDDGLGRLVLDGGWTGDVHRSGGGLAAPCSSGATEPEGAFHCHVPKEKPSVRARNQLIAVSVLCLVFMAGEIVGG